MKKLNRKDLICWIIAVILFLPTLLVLNESCTIIPNLIGIVYIGLLAWATKTKIGKMFWARLERIEDKLFGKIGV